MEVHAKTQELLDVLQSPVQEGVSRDQIGAVFATVIPMLIAATQRASELRGRVMMARIVEPNLEISQKLEHIKQTAGGMEKIAQDNMQNVERLLSSVSSIEADYAEVLAIIARINVEEEAAAAAVIPPPPEEPEGPEEAVTRVR